MPGPMLTVVVAETPRQGARAGPLVVLGHAILELTLLILLVVGLGPILEHHTVQAVLQIGGGLMLIWTAATMIVALVRHRVNIDWEGAAEGGKDRAVLLGIVSSLANPYWTI